jgi:uncharacterized membrane protein SpoIIM required for sporulation
VISTVTESAFAERRQADWNRLDELTHHVSERGISALDPHQLVDLAPLYRNACADLSRARAARYSAPLIDYLQGLTAAAHAVVYGAYARQGGAGLRGARLRRAIEAFPRAVRSRWKPITLAAVLFFGPLIFGALATLQHPEFALKLVPADTLKPLTEAYTKGFSEGRGVGAKTEMAGFYVNNNVGIALRCFALGIFGGIGSAFFLVDNGLSIGAILGYVASQGAGQNILTFVVGHSSLELGAIVLSGGAGLSLGWSVVAPGERSRLASLQASAREVVVIVFGAAVMLLMAAGIEAYFSSSALSAALKRTFGASVFLAVLLYMTLVGRTPRAAKADGSTPDTRWT